MGSCVDFHLWLFEPPALPAAPRTKLTRLVVMTFAVSAMSFSTMMGFTTVLPLVAPSGSGPVRWWLHVGPCLFLFVGCIFNYVSAALVDPGTPASAAYRRLVLEGHAAGVLSTASVETPSRMAIHPRLVADFGTRAWVMKPPFEWGFCERAAALKPPRAHRCSVTSDLVINMDHYCSWLYCTVGCEAHLLSPSARPDFAGCGALTQRR